MHDRRSEYARCTRSLAEDRGRDGASGIFDAALTNGLAAIVATRWPGQETNARGRTKSANDLVSVVEAENHADANGIYLLEDLDPPSGDSIFGAPRDPSPTRLDVAVLREAIERTQVIRHARAEAAQPLEERHVNALVALNDDSALRVSLERSEDVDEYEERILLEDAVEQTRARAYLDLLSIDEIERRAAVDYEEEYIDIDDGERHNTPHECPVCGTTALIEREVDSYVGEYPAGICVACSYVRKFDIADFEGKNERIRRAVEDPRT